MLYEEARVYLDHVSKYGSVLGLDSIKSLLGELGNPQNDLKFIHIAGTNGKGSVLACLSCILQEAGLCVGRYVSPTVMDYMERFQINGQWMAEDELALFVPEVKQAAEKVEEKTGGGRFPVHVRCLIDECANIGQIPNLEKLVATIRSREISACLVLQAQSQLKAIYKDNADTIIGNMDSRIFLGGSEPTTLKELNAALGKETIDTYNTSDTRGNSPSYGTNYQKLGKDLATVDELAVLDGSKCILQLRGVRPFMSDKYDLTQHPNYKMTADYDKKNAFDIEKFLNHKLKLKPKDVYEVIDADAIGG